MIDKISYYDIFLSYQDNKAYSIHLTKTYE